MVEKESIRIIEKPDEMSFDVIRELITEAHSVHYGKGYKMNTSQLSSSEILDRIGHKGKCWVALDGDKVVGTLSLRLVYRDKWYAKGEIPDYILASVIPEYTGKHIITRLSEKAFEYAISSGYSVMELDTAEMNYHAIDVYKHLGFHLVSYRAPINGDHNNVVMAKWLGNKKYPEWYCRIRFYLSKYRQLTKLYLCRIIRT